MVETRAASSRARDEDAEAKGDLWHKGVAISMWQNSGDEASNWTTFINSRLPFRWLPFGFKRYSGRWNVNERSPDTWNRCGGGEWGGAALSALRGGAREAEEGRGARGGTVRATGLLKLNVLAPYLPSPPPLAKKATRRTSASPRTRAATRSGCRSSGRASSRGAATSTSTRCSGAHYVF